MRRSNIKVVIAGAGGAAVCQGMVAAKTTLQTWCARVLVPLSGVDSLYSIVQMPGGVPGTASVIIDLSDKCSPLALRLFQ